MTFQDSQPSCDLEMTYSDARSILKHIDDCYITRYVSLHILLEPWYFHTAVGETAQVTMQRVRKLVDDSRDSI
jgi:hypothetical protein